MKIILAIGHPADVYFFKNFITEMENIGHVVVVLARNKEMTFYLLNTFNIQYIDMTTYKKSVFDKISNYLIRWYKTLRICKTFQPDISIGFGDFILPQISKILNFKSMVFTDIEYVFHDPFLTFPFASLILTPLSYKKKIGRKQIRFNGYKELAYINTSFKPNDSILNGLGISPKNKYVVLRFVSHSAVHDIRYSGLNSSMKISIVKEFVKYAKVFISSEEPLPKAIEKYKLKIAPEKMHDVIYYSTLLFGESSTMAAEAACMGTPAIFIDHKGRGYTDELEHKYHLVYNFRISDNHIKHAIEKGVEILMQDEKKHEWSSKKNIMIYSHVNMVDFMVKLIGKKTN